MQWKLQWELNIDNLSTLWTLKNLSSRVQTELFSFDKTVDIGGRFEFTDLNQEMSWINQHFLLALKNPGKKDDEIGFPGNDRHTH